MKKSIKRLCLLTIVLLIISATITMTMGNTYTTKFKIYKNDYKLVLEEDTDALEIVEEYEKGDEYIVKLKAKKKGRVFLSLNYGDTSTQKLFYVHKTLIITDNNFFGYSRGSEIIPISLSIILIYIIVIIFKIYKKSIQDNLYQYKNIAYLGIIIFTAGFTLNNLFSIINYQGIYETISKTISIVQIMSYLLFPLTFITFILVTISNIKLVIKEGKSIKNLLGLLLGIFICISTLLPDKLYSMLQSSQKINIYNLNGPGPYIYDFFETIIYLTVSYLECILIGTIIIAIKAIKKKVKYNKDYIIILGCQIKKDGSLTPLLKGRVDKALTFRNNQIKETNKDLIFIPSGGKGPDEKISEAEAMKNYLLKAGIKEKNIIIDDKSTNTYENIKFSNKLIKDKKANIAFSTTNYHVLRAGLIATEQGLKLEGIGSKTKTYFWINAFIREFVGTLYSERKKHLLVFILILLFIIQIILITYFANNI